MIRKSIFALGFVLLIQILVAAPREKAPVSLVQYARNTLSQMGRDPIIIREIRKQNAVDLSMEEIRNTNNRWRSARGLTEFMKPYIQSTCGQHLIAIHKSKRYFCEIIALDKRGVNVAMSDWIRDYWHGDKESFINAYNNGTGSLYVGDVRFDTSLQAYMVQIGVPVYDGEEVIGVISLGVDVDEFER